MKIEINQNIQNKLLDIYEISLALQWIPTSNHLEKKDPKILGELLEKKYNKLILLIFNKNKK